MDFIHSTMRALNSLSGLFLFFIWLSAGSCAASLSKMKSEMECLHADFDRVHDAHERANAQDEYDPDIDSDAS